MIDTYDGLKVGDKLSQIELQKQNVNFYNNSIIGIPTGATATDGTAEYILVNASDFFDLLGKGLIPEHSFIYKFGRNPAVGATEVLIAAENMYGLPPTAETVTVTSDNAADVPGGAGARSVHIFGLDANFEPIDEIVNLGATSILEFIRVFRTYVETAGNTGPVGGANAGIITITQSTSLINMIAIEPNDGQTLCACYTVPSGYKAYIWAADTTVGEGKTSTNRLKVREFATDSPFRVKGIRDNFENVVGVNFKIPGEYDEKSDIVFTAISTAAGTAVSGTFMIELVKK